MCKSTLLLSVTSLFLTFAAAAPAPASSKRSAKKQRQQSPQRIAAVCARARVFVCVCVCSYLIGLEHLRRFSNWRNRGAFSITCECQTNENILYLEKKRSFFSGTDFRVEWLFVFCIKKHTFESAPNQE